MKLFISISWLLIVCFSALLVWCGDADCLDGSGDANCASLVCSLMGKHDGSTAHDDISSDAECTCICHAPSIPMGSFVGVPLISSEKASDQISPDLMQAPLATPFRPPTSA